MVSTILTILFLATLIVSIIDDAFGYVVMVNDVDPSTLDPGRKVTTGRSERGTAEAYPGGAPIARRYRAIERELPLAEREGPDLLELP
jgi:hypothetical protein